MRERNEQRNEQTKKHISNRGTNKRSVPGNVRDRATRVAVGADCLHCYRVIFIIRDSISYGCSFDSLEEAWTGERSTGNGGSVP